MALGTSLYDDILTALEFGSKEQFGIDMQTAVDSYIDPADYGNGAVLVSSSTTAINYELDKNGTAKVASEKIAAEVESYFSNASVSPGTPQNGGVKVLSPVITYSSVYSTTQPALETEFLDKGSKEDAATGIETAISDGVLTVTCTWSEQLSDGSTIGPFSGVIS